MKWAGSIGGICKTMIPIDRYPKSWAKILLRDSAILLSLSITGAFTAPYAGPEFKVWGYTMWAMTAFALFRAGVLVLYGLQFLRRKEGQSGLQALVHLLLFALIFLFCAMIAVWPMMGDKAHR